MEFKSKVNAFVKNYRRGRLLAMVQENVLLPEKLLDGDEGDEEETLMILEDPSILLIDDDDESVEVGGNQTM